MLDEQLCRPIFRDEHGLYRFATCLLFAASFMTLILINCMCPVHGDSKDLVIRSKRQGNKNDKEDVETKIVLVPKTHSSSTLKSFEGNKNKLCSKFRAPSTNATIEHLSEDDNDDISRQRSVSTPHILQSNIANVHNQVVRKNSVSFQLFDRPQHDIYRYGMNINSPLLKRAGSSQELMPFEKTSILTAYDSMPDINKSSINSLNKIRSRGNILQLTDKDEIDEGQMKCAIQFDKKRMSLVVKSLSVQTILPAGIPGFNIEISLVPTSSQIVRSKIYVVKQRNINITLDEDFVLDCTDKDLETSSLVLTIKPILGNMILYAETELKDLDLPFKTTDVYLGGFLKGLNIKNLQM